MREGVLAARVPPDGLTPAAHTAAVDRVTAQVADVPGLARVGRALRVAKTPAAAAAAALALTGAGSGMSGRAVALMSGGIDCPVAAAAQEYRPE